MNPDRRGFLSWLATGAVAGSVGIGALRASGYRVAPQIAKKLITFRPWQFVVLEAIGARVLFPESAEVGLFADQYASGLPERDRDDLSGLIAYVEHVAPIRHGYARRFTSLFPEEQDEVLRGIEESAFGLLRGGFQALKAVAMMAFYRRENSWAAIGYPGPAVRWSSG